MGLRGEPWGCAGTGGLDAMFQPIHHHRCPLRASPWRFQPEIAMAITLRPPPNPEEERAPLASRQPWFSFAPTFICKRRGEKKGVKFLLQDPENIKGVRASISCGGRAGAGRDMPWDRGDHVLAHPFLVWQPKLRGREKTKPGFWGECCGSTRTLALTPAKAFCAGYVGYQNAG